MNGRKCPVNECFASFKFPYLWGLLTILHTWSGQKTWRGSKKVLMSWRLLELVLVYLYVQPWQSLQNARHLAWQQWKVMCQKQLTICTWLVNRHVKYA